MAEVVVNGVKLSYEVRGEGPSVLFINGGLVTSAMAWITGAQAIADAGYKVIVFDNRGVLPSDVPPPPYTVEDMADDAVGLMEHLDLGPYLVVGSSMGGLIAQSVCLRRPDLVRAVIFNITSGAPSAYSRVIHQAMVDVIDAVGEMPQSVLTALMLTYLLTPAQLMDDKAVEFAVAVAGMFGTAPSDCILGHLGAVLKWSSEDHVGELSGLQMPALAIANEHDVIFRPSKIKQAVDAMPQGEYVEIADAAHVAVDKGEVFLQRVLSFLAKHVDRSVSAQPA